MVEQLESDLDKTEDWVALEILPHDWLDLPFEQGTPIQWRNGAGGRPWLLK